VSKPDHPMQKMRDIMDELGGVGTEITLNATISGLVDFGEEVQVVLDNGLFMYLPLSTVRGAVNRGK
jgi:hypothetical protein